MSLKKELKPRFGKNKSAEIRTQPFFVNVSQEKWDQIFGKKKDFVELLSEKMESNVLKYGKDVKISVKFLGETKEKKDEKEKLQYENGC